MKWRTIFQSDHILNRSCRSDVFLAQLGYSGKGKVTVVMGEPRVSIVAIFLRRASTTFRTYRGDTFTRVTLVIVCLRLMAFTHKSVAAGNQLFLFTVTRCSRGPPPDFAPNASGVFFRLDIGRRGACFRRPVDLVRLSCAWPAANFHQN